MSSDYQFVNPLSSSIDTDHVFDVIVVGLGAMGCSSLYHLAKRGLSVLAIERFDEVGHALGSSHGETRIIRKAYFEHPQYVPLVLRAYELWHELELAVGQRLLHYTGGLDIGTPDSPMVQGALQACREHNLPYEIFDEHNLRWPGLQLPRGYVAVYQKDAAVLQPEKCNRAHFLMATKFGAKTVFGETVVDVSSRDQDILQVETANGLEFRCRHVVVAAGPWVQAASQKWSVMRKAPSHLAKSLESLIVERQVVSWYRPAAPDIYSASRFPIFLVHHKASSQTQSPKKLGGTATKAVSTPDHDQFYYGFPILKGDSGVKVSRYNHLFEVIDPSAVPRRVLQTDLDTQNALIDNFLPGLRASQSEVKRQDAQHVKSSVCMFTNTADGHFILDTFSPFTGQLVSRSGREAPTVLAGPSFQRARVTASSLRRPSENSFRKWSLLAIAKTRCGSVVNALILLNRSFESLLVSYSLPFSQPFSHLMFTCNVPSHSFFSSV